MNDQEGAHNPPEGAPSKHWAEQIQRLVPTRQEADPFPELQMPARIRPVERFSQQQVQRELDAVIPKGERPQGDYYCLPVQFFALARANGYTQPYQSDIATFVSDVFRGVRNPDRGWSRPGMSKEMRFLYNGMPVVSWQTGKNTQDSLTNNSLEAMVDSGYLLTNQEVGFFRENIVGRQIPEIVQAGYPVLVTVSPEFGENRGAHSIIIDGWDDNGVHVVDSNERNPYDLYGPEYVEEYLAGACTVIPPLNESDWPGLKDWKESRNQGGLRLDRSG